MVEGVNKKNQEIPPQAAEWCNAQTKKRGADIAPL